VHFCLKLKSIYKVYPRVRETFVITLKMLRKKVMIMNTVLKL